MFFAVAIVKMTKFGCFEVFVLFFIFFVFWANARIFYVTDTCRMSNSFTAASKTLTSGSVAQRSRSKIEQ